MSDRDRLAADLHDIACGASARAEWDVCVRDHRHEADRMIERGWMLAPVPKASPASAAGRGPAPDKYAPNYRMEAYSIHAPVRRPSRPSPTRETT